jgi:hypothetical protein
MVCAFEVALAAKRLRASPATAAGGTTALAVALRSAFGFYGAESNGIIAAALAIAGCRLSIHPRVLSLAQQLLRRLLANQMQGTQTSDATTSVMLDLMLSSLATDGSVELYATAAVTESGMTSVFCRVTNSSCSECSVSMQQALLVKGVHDAPPSLQLDWDALLSFGGLFDPAFGIALGAMMHYVNHGNSIIGQQDTKLHAMVSKHEQSRSQIVLCFNCDASGRMTISCSRS